MLYRQAVAHHLASGRQSDAVNDLQAQIFELTATRLQYAEAQARLREVEPWVPGYDEGRARLLYFRAALHHEIGDLRQAMRDFADAAARTHRLGMSRDHRNVLQYWAWRQQVLGRVDEASALLDEVDASLSDGAGGCDRVSLLTNRGWYRVIVNCHAGARINEVLYDPEGNEDLVAAWVELFVSAGGSASLRGWELTNLGSRGQSRARCDLAQLGRLEGGHHLVDEATFGGCADGVGTGGFALRCCPTPETCETIDVVCWGDLTEAVECTDGHAAAVEESVALCRCPDTNDTNDNQADFKSCRPSPGAPNDGCPCATDCNAAIVLNEILYDPDGLERASTAWVELAGPAGACLPGPAWPVGRSSFGLYPS